MTAHYGERGAGVAAPTYSYGTAVHYAEHFNHMSNSSNSSSGDAVAQQLHHHHQQQQQQQTVVQQQHHQQQQQQHHPFDLSTEDSVLAAATLINQLSPQEPTYVNL